MTSPSNLVRELYPVVRHVKRVFKSSRAKDGALPACPSSSWNWSTGCNMSLSGTDPRFLVNHVKPPQLPPGDAHGTDVAIHISIYRY